MWKLISKSCQVLDYLVLCPKSFAWRSREGGIESRMTCRYIFAEGHAGAFSYVLPASWLDSVWPSSSHVKLCGLSIGSARKLSPRKCNTSRVQTMAKTRAKTNLFFVSSFLLFLCLFTLLLLLIFLFFFFLGNVLGEYSD